MAIANSALLQLTGEFLLLLEESADYHSDPTVQQVLRDARAIATAHYRRLQCGKRHYVIAVVGLTNVGKSTLMNALFGCDIAPRRNGPCTAAPIEFSFGDAYQVMACYHHTASRKSFKCANVAEIHERLSQLADDSGAEASRNIRKVEVLVPHPLLCGNLVIADTPGFGAAQSGDAVGSHEAALRHYLQHEVSQVLWIVLAEQGVTKRECDFYESLLLNACDDVVVTGCDGWEQMELDKWRRTFSEHLDKRMLRFHFVSGKQGCKARQTGDTALLEVSGITRLEKRLCDLADPIKRTATIQEDIKSLAGDIANWLAEYRGPRDLGLNQWWRPDSWDRWKLAPACAGLRDTITSLLGG